MKLSIRPITRAAGFSLIELLAVIVILSILMVFLIPNLTGAGAVVKAQSTSAFLGEIDTALSEYHAEFGAYPKSKFKAKWGISSNPTNTGAESMVMHLWSTEGWGGTTISTDRFCNTDNDSAKNNVVDPDVIGNGALMELSDAWENPIAYIHRSQYGEKFLYTTFEEETGELIESQISAFKNPATGAYFKPRKYQLISAGEDGVFGTEDDITNFDRGD